jgi:hypothetical protein
MELELLSKDHLSTDYELELCQQNS